MYGFAASKLAEFEEGKISRRALIQALTLAATTTTAAAPEARAALAPDPALTVALVNHISYTCPDFHAAADWYSRVFNLDQVAPRKNDVTLPFGKLGEKPYNVSANDVPLTHLIIRTRDPQPGEGRGPKRKPRALINHIAYTIADFDAARVRAELKRLAFTNPREDGEHSFHIKDLNGYDVQISGVSMTALAG
jgi:catechol 2,3-dioxygenase-like lactoylglutathione lyase family enzyme